MVDQYLRGVLDNLLRAVLVERRRLSEKLVALGRRRDVVVDTSRHLAAKVQQLPEFAAIAEAIDRVHRVGGDAAKDFAFNFLAQNRVFHEEDPTGAAFFNQVLLSLNEHLRPRRQVTITYLFGLPWISEECLEQDIDVGWFKIVRFSSDALSSLIKNDVRTAFFPYSSLREEVIRALSRQVWLVTSEKRTVDEHGLVFDWSDLDETVTYTKMPPRLEAALRRLVLLKWNCIHSDHSQWWPGFAQSCLLEISDNFYETPSKPKLVDDFDFDEYGIILPPQYQSDEIWLLSDIDGCLTQMEADRRTRFLSDTVLSFIIRGVFIPVNSATKRDQFVSLVWAVESLVGTEGAGLAQRNSERIEVLLGKEAAQVFHQRLWKCRNALVHGDHVNRIPVERSWEAWELAWAAARATYEILREYMRADIFLDRKEFLWLLDTHSHFGRINKRRLTTLLQRWPGGGRQVSGIGRED